MTSISPTNLFHAKSLLGWTEYKVAETLRGIGFTVVGDLKTNRELLSCWINGRLDRLSHARECELIDAVIRKHGLTSDKTSKECVRVALLVDVATRVNDSKLLRDIDPHQVNGQTVRERMDSGKIPYRAGEDLAILVDRLYNVTYRRWASIEP